MSTRNHLALTPPMGFNSWDSYGTTISEEEVHAIAAVMAEKLKPHGWEYLVIDAAWFDPQATASGYSDPSVFVLDEYGRYLPAPGRFPSAAGGAGFKPLADHLHSLGLKLGLHFMRGIPRLAYERDLPVLGTPYTARQVANPEDVCDWNTDNYGVRMDHPGGQAYYDSVFRLCAEWGVDYIKADDLTAPYHTAEVEGISKAIASSGREIVLSLSPGNHLGLEHARHLQDHSELWRISADLWDGWTQPEEYYHGLKDQFALCAAWQPFSGPGHWPDADMLTLGRIGPRTPHGEDRPTTLTPDEQYAMMALWSIARSPLMFGGDPLSLDAFTLDLLTNPEVLAVNQHSAFNRQLFNQDGRVAWCALEPETGHVFLALFNTADAEQDVPVSLEELGLGSQATVRDLWKRADLGIVATEIAPALPPHAVAFYKLQKHES